MKVFIQLLAGLFFVGCATVPPPLTNSFGNPDLAKYKTFTIGNLNSSGTSQHLRDVPILKNIAFRFQQEGLRYVKKIDKADQEKRAVVIALEGELGAGKTTFVQGFAKGLKIQDKIISPTFVLIRQHQIPKTERTLYHIDLYRLENTKNIEELGIKELLKTSQDIVLIEWADKIKKHLSTLHEDLQFDYQDKLEELSKLK